jgi:Rieske 2Fe-2S family protein
MTTFVRASIPDAVRTLPGHYYSSPELFAEEQERIFAENWTCVGRSEQAAEAGAFFLVELGGESLIMVRDGAGKLHAHFNVCRHRGTRICEGEGGRFGETIQCPYHAWTYALDGKLVGARHMQDAPGFRKNDWSLRSAAVAEWDGFVFANLAASPEPFDAHFAPLLGRFAEWDAGTLRRGAQVVYDVAANWKLIVQNYSECYHCPLIHPDLVARSPWQSGRNDLSAGPFLGGYMDLSHDSASMTVDGASPRPYLPGLSHENRRRVYYYAIFPNLLLSLHPDYVMAHTLWPQEVGRTRVICEWYFAQDQLAAPEFDPSDAVSFWNLTNLQDWHVCELSQLGVRSRAYTPGPYAQAEGLLWQFDQEYLRRMGIAESQDPTIESREPKPDGIPE